MIEALKEQLYLYNLLRYLFLQEPTEEVLNEISRIEVSTEHDNDIDHGLSLMMNSIKKNKDHFDKWLEELAVEYAQLFIGPARPPAVPYASFYLSESHSLMTDETIDVRKRYLEARLSVKELYSVPDDHIGIELEFLCYLTSEIICAHEAGGAQGRVSALESARDEFVHGHLLRWVPAFADRLVADPRGDEFFKGAALLLREVLSTYSEASQENDNG